MSIIKKIFSFNSEPLVEPNIMFGRYSDSYKSDEKYTSWDRSLDLFEKNEYHAAYLEFFEYLKDDITQNVSFVKEGNTIHFELFQGSKKTVGNIADGKIWAEAKIAKSTENAIGILRTLIELNFNLKYCRYALDRDENITMVFNSYFLDCSPYKLYYALKEISTHADKQDDILISEFDELEEVNTGHIRDIDDTEKRIKYDFLIKKVNQAIDSFENGKLNKTTYPGGKTFQLLDSVYKLDYLLKPEGVTMLAFENMHKHFFKNDGETVHKKNNYILKQLKKVVETVYEDFDEEVYEVLSTFGVTSPTSFEQFKSFTEGELGNMDWYVENNYSDVGLAIPSYIVGYSLFNFALPAPLSQLLHSYYRVTEEDYFQSLGYKDHFMKSGQLNKSTIKTHFKQLRNKFKNEYPNFNPDGSKLDYGSLVSFSKSFLNMATKLDLRKQKRTS